LNLEHNTSYVEVLDNANLRLSSGGSVGVWVKPSSNISSNGSTILNKGAAGDRNPRLTIETNKTLNFFWEDESTGDNENTIAGALTTDVWTYIVCTWDGTTNKIYYNDALDDSESESGTPAVGTIASSLFIGKDPTDADGHFQGEIDDLVFYSDVLELAEVKRNYNAGKRSHR